MYFEHACSSVLTSIKNLNNACSSASVTKGSNKELYVRTKSTVPYSTVDNTAVYKGNRKKPTSCVQIFPNVIMAVGLSSFLCKF